MAFLTQAICTSQRGQYQKQMIENQLTIPRFSPAIAPASGGGGGDSCPDGYPYGRGGCDCPSEDDVGVAVTVTVTAAGHEADSVMVVVKGIGYLGAHGHDESMRVSGCERMRSGDAHLKVGCPCRRGRCRSGFLARVDIGSPYHLDEWCCRLGREVWSLAAPCRWGRKALRCCLQGRMARMSLTGR